MELKRDIEIENNAIIQNLNRLTNQVYKLLPLCEEGGDWHGLLETVLEELYGMDEVLIGQHYILFQLICRLEGLIYLSERDQFDLYRNTIFKCLSLIDNLKNLCQD